MTILCYHSVDDSWSDTLVIPPDDFARQCRWLKRKRTVVDLAEAADRVSPSGRLPRRWTALTFDDGYAALYDHAWPVLRELNLPSTIFLVAETLTEQGRTVDWIDNPPAAPPATLTLEQVREMQEDGVRFESHSYSHHDLTTLREDECVRDLRTSREQLSDLLHREVKFLAYPRGRHNEAVRRAAERAGYRYAVSLPETREPTGRFAIPRAGVYPHNGLVSLAAKSSGWYLRFRTGPLFPWVRRALRGHSKNAPRPS